MEKFGYNFNDDKLITQALTHSSYANERNVTSNERLEFLGDSVLSLIVSRHIFSKYTGFPEGRLTKIRASVVCEATLAKCAKKIGIGNEMILGKGEDNESGRARASMLSDAFEAVLAAVFLDGGIEKASEWVMAIMKEEIEFVVDNDVIMDYKTALQEVFQRDSKRVEYEIIKVEGPDHARIYTVGALSDGQMIADAQGKTRKEAEQNVAKKILEKM